RLDRRSAPGSRHDRTHQSTGKLGRNEESFPLARASAFAERRFQTHSHRNERGIVLPHSVEQHAQPSAQQGTQARKIHRLSLSARNDRTRDRSLSRSFSQTKSRPASSARYRERLRLRRSLRFYA